MTNGVLRTDQNNHQGLGEVFNLRRYSNLIWRRLWLIALSALIAGALGYFISLTIPPIYLVSTKLLVIEAAANKPIDYNSVMANQNLTSTYADMLVNEALLKEVITRLNLPITLNDLSNSIKVAPVRNTQLISITVEGKNPKEISLIANTMVEIFIQRIETIQSTRYASSLQNLVDQLKNIDMDLKETKSKISTADSSEKERLEAQIIEYQQIYASLLTNYEQTRLTQAQSTNNVIQVNIAQPPIEPIYPKVMVNTLILALMASVFATAVVLLIDAFDDTVKMPEQITSVLGLPVLAVIYTHKNDAKPITQEQPRSIVSEAFRTLRTNIHYTDVDRPFRTLLITSPSPEEGKTVVSTNLATIYAQNECKTLLIDADLRRPAVHRRMNIPNSPGMTTLLQQLNFQLNGILIKTRGLYIIPSGDLPSNPVELLGSKRMSWLLDVLKNQFDVVVIDTPPILPVADSLILASKVDGVLLVLKPGKTKIAMAKLAVEQLKRVNANIIGVIINDVNIKSLDYKQHYNNKFGEYIHSIS